MGIDEQGYIDNVDELKAMARDARTAPRVRFHQGRHTRRCHVCDERLVDGELIVLVPRPRRAVRSRMYRTTYEEAIPRYYHDKCHTEKQ